MSPVKPQPATFSFTLHGSYFRYPTVNYHAEAKGGV